MSPETLRTIERLHAVVAWAAAGSLCWSAWVVARERAIRGAAVALGATAAGLVLLAGGLGLALHDPFRSRLRQKLFLESASLGWLFERKHHLAFAAILLAVSALAALVAARRVDEPAGPPRDLRRSAALAFAAAGLFASIACVVSAIVAQHQHF